MKDQYQLIPHKHVRFADSLLALAGVVRQCVSETPQTLDELWGHVEQSFNAQGWPRAVSFGQYLLAVDVLFALGQVEPFTEDTVRAVKAESGTADATD